MSLSSIDIPPADHTIRSATQTREYPSTKHAAAASGGWLDAAGTTVRLGRWVDDHLVAEVFELGYQPSGVRFVVAAGVPVGAQVVVGLVAFQHPVGRHQDGVRDRNLGSPHPAPAHQPGRKARSHRLADTPPGTCGATAGDRRNRRAGALSRSDEATKPLRGWGDHCGDGVDVGVLEAAVMAAYQNGRLASGRPLLCLLVVNRAGIYAPSRPQHTPRVYRLHLNAQSLKRAIPISHTLTNCLSIMSCGDCPYSAPALMFHTTGAIEVR